MKELFSGMNCQEIQSAADEMLSHSGFPHISWDTKRLLILVANLAARMKEQDSKQPRMLKCVIHHDRTISSPAWIEYIYED